VPVEVAADDSPSESVTSQTVIVVVVGAVATLVIAIALFVKRRQNNAPKCGELTVDKSSLSTKSSLELQTSQKKHKKNPHAVAAGTHDVAFTPLNNGEDEQREGGFKNPRTKKLRSKFSTKLGAVKSELKSKLGGSSSSAGKKTGKAGTHEARALLGQADQDDGDGGADAFAKELSRGGVLQLRPPTSKQRLSGEEYEEHWAELCEDEQEAAAHVPARPQLRVQAGGEPRDADNQIKAVSKALGSDVVLLAEGIVGSDAKWYFYSYSNECTGGRTGGTIFMGGITAVVPISTLSICCRSSDEAKLPRFLEMMRVRLATAS
jgi:hypothetical protein